jgi:hypothetical protein
MRKGTLFIKERILANFEDVNLVSRSQITQTTIPTYEEPASVSLTSGPGRKRSQDKP